MLFQLLIYIGYKEGTNLKLVRTYSNCRLLRTSTAAIFLSNDNSLNAPIASDKRHAWFHLYGLSLPARSPSKMTKYKIKNYFPQSDSNPQLWYLYPDYCSVKHVRFGATTHRMAQIEVLVTILDVKVNYLIEYKYKETIIYSALSTNLFKV